MIAFINENCFAEVMNELSSSVILENIVNEEQDVNTFTLYNFSSAINRGVRLSTLIPPTMLSGEQIDVGNERTFDMMYAKYIMEDNAAFADMFSIINNLYSGGSSIILVGNSIYKDLLSESFIKFLQQRYGLNPIRIINEIEDWFSYDDEGNFNLVGVYNLDLDKERYTMLTTDFSKLDVSEEG